MDLSRISDDWYKLRESVIYHVEDHFPRIVFEGLPGEVKDSSPTVHGNKVVYLRSMYAECLRVPFKLGDPRSNWESSAERLYNAS